MTMATQSTPSKELTEANSKFAIDLYKQLATEGDDNIFFSPVSISIALAMTYLGAKNKTAEEMKNALHFDAVEEGKLHPSFANLQDAVQCKDGSFKLNTANKLFGNNKFAFLPKYIKDTKTNYKAELTPMDFGGNGDGSVLEINKWVEDQTAGKIKDLLAAGSIDGMTAMILVNAIYFKGDWANKFDAEDTKPSPFYVTANDQINVDMMFQEAKFLFGRSNDLECKSVALPYINNKLSMFIILPDKKDGLSALETKLQADHFTDIEKSLRMREVKVKVSLPRFKMTRDFDLGTVLNNLGIKELFNEDKADLTGMSSSGLLYVSKVIHKAFVEVNEEGTEAAAATAVQVMARSIPKIFEVKCDHPFLFFIRENQSQSILFMGRMLKPSAAGGKDEL